MTVPFAFQCLTKMNERGASDLYLTLGHPPSLRIENYLENIGAAPLDEELIQDILASILTARQLRDFETKMELNTSLDMGGYGRFRVNVFRQRQAPGLVIRRIISKIPSLEELRLPPALSRMAMEPRGLVLVTGMTGSGKSTTLASMLNYRNERTQGHILTIEDPIEYYHEHKKSVVTQREVGVDTESYYAALKNSLRQRPDVILIGEIRDREVMEQALTIAETGHLCLATLHTNNAYQAIERIVNFFPEEFHNQTRLNLSMNLKAIVSQRLLPSLMGGQVPALEILINQALIREQIQSGDYEKIPEVMEQNATIGMCTFDQSLMKLYVEGHISEETAITQSDKSSDMAVKIRQLKLGKGGSGLGDLDTSGLKMSDAY
jgi:twitching motility protein PilU